jgi:hypothetical protein
MKQQKISFRLAVTASTFLVALGLTACTGSTPAATNAPAVLAATSAPAATSVPATPSAPQPTPRAARPAPTVSFSFTQPTVNSGTQPTLTYSSGNLPAGSEIILQLAYGTPTEWDSAKTLSGSGGTATLAALPAGVYQFRLTAERGVTVAAISPARILSVVQPASSSCGVCSILGGVGGAIAAWLLSLIPW